MLMMKKEEAAANEMIYGLLERGLKHRFPEAHALDL